LIRLVRFTTLTSQYKQFSTLEKSLKFQNNITILIKIVSPKITLQCLTILNIQTKT
jgi:hypothetical protein